MALPAGLKGLSSVNLRGVVLVQPYFLEKYLIGVEAFKASVNQGKLRPEKIGLLVHPSLELGSDDPLINPYKDPIVGKCWFAWLRISVEGSRVVL
ncbi:hypothetical protein TorRG33x02_253750 [Trema orientale]|uniref:Uncharacterized protein n=1 Tax=Trema orientale TaxID=63057 RepID=A0A2P5DE77_TREOI|nr:hypothetical protein TorRG33x02_253750 [Trema orientale]